MRLACQYIGENHAVAQPRLQSIQSRDAKGIALNWNLGLQSGSWTPGVNVETRVQGTGDVNRHLFGAEQSRAEQTSSFKVYQQTHLDFFL